MRLATVRTESGPRLHVRVGATYVDVATTTGDPSLVSLAGLLAGGERSLNLVRAVDGPGVDAAAANLGPAVPEPGRILCLGLNYGEHARETGWLPPSWPETFVRGSQSITGPFDPIVAPQLSTQLDYEGELGVVIGRGGRYIPSGEAMDAILGFTVLNEVTARDWQRAAKQWTPGKNFDNTMPIGPEVVTGDEIDVSDLAVTTTLNGELMQSGRTSQMLTSITRAIEFFSSFTTLVPGDVIATGTPAGVGFTRTPPVYLRPGDVVEVSIEQVGTIRNQVVAESDAPTDWPWAVEFAETGRL